MFVALWTGVAMLRLPASLLDRVLLRMQRSSSRADRVLDDTSIVEESAGGVTTTWIAPELRNEGVVVFLHGGAYVGGPARGQWAWVGEMSRRTGAAGALVHYRMPPEHPFPAALDDALAAVAGMFGADQLRGGRWILAGDSAGGGLALATAQALRDRGEPLPAGLVLTAPWVDIAMDNPDLLDDKPRTYRPGRSLLRWSAERYAAGHRLDDPRLSPLHGSMAELPPVHVNVGTDDLFLPDVRRLRVALEEAGVEVTSIEQQGGAHTYPQEIVTPEAEWTIRSQAEWINAVMNRGAR